MGCVSIGRARGGQVQNGSDDYDSADFMTVLFFILGIILICFLFLNWVINKADHD